MTTLKFDQGISYVGPRPKLLVRIAAGESGPWRQHEAILDTGANECAFGRQLGQSLGLTLEDPAPDDAATGGGLIHGWRRQVFVEIVEINLRLRPFVFFAEGRREPPLIGTTGVMDHVVIGLRHGANRLYLAVDPAPR